MEAFVYIGTYTGDRAGGIHAYRFDTESGKLAQALPVTQARDPSYLAASGGYLVAVAETDSFGGEYGGGVLAFARDASTGVLTLLSAQPTHGRAPCHITADASGRFLFAANYTDGTVSVFPLSADGTIGAALSLLRHAGSGPVAGRQEGPHAHSVVLTPDGKFLCAADLGCDSVFVYPFDARTGVSAEGRTEVKLRSGAGPRHVAFHPSGRFAYVITELSNEVAAFSYLGDGQFESLQYISTLPADYAGKSWCAAIHVSPDGRFLYASNREHDSIAVFSIDESTGKLELVQIAPCGGRWPREFAIDPTGRWMIVGHEKSDGLAVFAVDKASGRIEATGERAEVTKPVCIQFVS